MGVFGKVDREIHKKQIQLQEMQNSILFVDDVRKEKIIREELEVLMHWEELMWAQKARSDWIVLGDRNTRCFQIVVKQRRARSRILNLKTVQGDFTDNPVEIENTLVNHFKQYYEGPTLGDFDSILEEIRTLPIPQLSEQ